MPTKIIIVVLALIILWAIKDILSLGFTGLDAYHQGVLTGKLLVVGATGWFLYLQIKKLRKKQ
jgi:hypothetical protein